MNNIFHSQYEKITDDILFLGFNCVMRMNVVLAKRTNEGVRKGYHSEYMYKQKGDDVITLRRSFDYYISIENIKKTYDNDKEFIRIGNKEFMAYKNMIKQSIMWFTHEKYNNVFATKNGKLVMTRSIPDLELKNLPLNKYLIFECRLIVKGGVVETIEPGVRIYLSSSNNYVDINLDVLMSIYSSLEGFNMYIAAQNMINYLGRPDYGTNLMSFDKAIVQEPIEETVTKVRKRTIPGMNNLNNL